MSSKIAKILPFQYITFNNSEETCLKKINEKIMSSKYFSKKKNK